VWQAAVAAAPGRASADIPSSAAIDVSAADGSGTLSAAPTSVAAGSGANTLAFTYTAPTGGVSGGTLTIAVPPGWTPPVTSDAAGCTTASGGSVSTDGGTIVVSGLALAADTSAVITYGATSGGGCAPGDGVTAPPAPGPSAFAATEASSAGGTPHALAVAPAVRVG
jgi:hypothetical protein